MKCSECGAEIWLYCAAGWNLAWENGPLVPGSFRRACHFNHDETWSDCPKSINESDVRKRAIYRKSLNVLTPAHTVETPDPIDVNPTAERWGWTRLNFPPA